MERENTIKLTIQSKAENIGIARITVAAFIAQVDLTIDELEDIKVAVSEAVSNSIIHGYGGSSNQWVELEVIKYENHFEIIISDYGKGIENIEKAMEPAFSTDSQRMGLGFVFMQSFMDEVKVESELNKGTKVSLIKKCLVVPGTPN